MNEYPSGGNYPETHDDWVEHFLRLISDASPEQMNSFTVKEHKRGGKLAALADLLAGIIDFGDFERMEEENGWSADD